MASESLFLYRKARLFRYAGYAVTALILAALVCTGRPTVLVGLAVAYCCAAPCLIDWAKSRRGGWNIGYQGVENFAILAIAGLAAAPPLVTLLVVTAVATGNVAQGGLRFLKVCIPLMLLGWLAGAWVFVSVSKTAPGIVFASTTLADGLSALALLVFVCCISSLGYRQTMRMYHTREELREKSEELHRLNERIARYLAPQVTRRLFSRGEPLLALKRKWVTVCFVDIAHFTRMTSELAPEELAMVLNDYLKEMSRLAARVGGMVDKFIGDAVMIIFGDPVSEGRHQEAERAIQLVLDLPGCLVELSQFWADQGLDQTLSVRVGLASGYCSVGDFGNEDRLDYTVVGKAVNLASRLQTQAGVNEALVDRASFGLLARKELFQRTGALEVRGIQHPVEAYCMKLEHRGCPVVDLDLGSDKVRASLQ